jgi:hypothetical protein
MLILLLQNWISVGCQKVQGRCVPATPEQRGNLDMLVGNWPWDRTIALRGKDYGSSSLKRSETCGVDARECFIVHEESPMMIRNYIIEPHARGMLSKPKSGPFIFKQEKYS